jgi:hypothetical protein
MNVGMLWFDNDSKSDLNTKVGRAAEYYAGKYGNQPNLCFIHPSMAVLDQDMDPTDQSLKAGEIEVRLTKSVLHHHIWIGTALQDESLVT